MNQQDLSGPVRTAIEIAVYLLLIFAILALCLRIISPFVVFVVWGGVIAVAVYKPYLALRAMLGGRSKLAVALFVLLGLGVILVPTWMFAGSLFDNVQDLRNSVESGQFHIPPPGESVKGWPLVGDKLYQNWSQAAANFEGWLEAHSAELRPIVAGVLGKVAGIGLSILQFIMATVIAAAMLANDQSAKASIRRLAHRLIGDNADGMLELSAATIRSVTVGVLGIAFIQAMLGGAGMMVAGVPGAGIWALIILVLAIAQLPPLLVLLPAVIYVFSHNDSTTISVIFAVWSVLVSFADAALKPLLLGRGVEAPMLVILLGAIGGMLYSGIIGLFLGAVVLALGYKMFMAWLASGEAPPEEAQPAEKTG